MRTTTRTRSIALALGAVASLGLAACSTTDDGATTETESAADTTVATANIVNTSGDDIGTATIEDVDDGSLVSVEVNDLEPGMHGLHIHSTGLCETDSSAEDDPDETGDFLSSEGHLGDGDHPDHAGDLPALLVQENGHGQLSATTDRLDRDELFDEDGSALIIHEKADNYANIPERYAEDGPDSESKGAGDAGSRIACGVFEEEVD